MKQHQKRVPTYKEGKIDWNLTKSQWLVYYWLLTRARYGQGQNHYFIYFQDETHEGGIHYPTIMRDTGIKSKTTVINALKGLEKAGAICRDDYNDKAFQIYCTNFYTDMNIYIILYLLAYHDYIDCAAAIALLSIIGFIHNNEKLKTKKYTRAELAALMGKCKKNMSRYDIDIILCLLEAVKVLKITRTPYTNRLGVKSIMLGFDEVNLGLNPVLEAMVDDSGAINKSRIKEIFTELPNFEICGP